MPFDPILRWTKSPSLDVAKYSVAWTRNGAAAGAGDVARDGAADQFGYSARYSAHNPPPAPTIGDGDVITATVRAVDASGLASAAVAAIVTLPSEPPAAPTDVTLALS